MSHGTSCSWFQPVKAWLWHTYAKRLLSDQGMVIQLGRCSYPFQDMQRLSLHMVPHLTVYRWIQSVCEIETFRESNSILPNAPTHSMRSLISSYCVRTLVLSIGSMDRPMITHWNFLVGFADDSIYCEVVASIVTPPTVLRNVIASLPIVDTSSSIRPFLWT